MHFTTLAVGFLALASEPFQSLVSGRAIEQAGQDIEARALIHWGTKERLKRSDINDDIGTAPPRVKDVFAAEGEKAKAIHDGDWYVKLAERDDQVRTEINVYKALEGENITPKFLALIVDDDDKDNVIGFAVENLADAREFNRNSYEDKQEADRLINIIHRAGWSHEDATADNFLHANGRSYVIDFEISKNVKGKESNDKEELDSYDNGFGMYNPSTGQKIPEEDLEDAEESD